MSTLTSITDASFADDVLNSNQLTLVDFWAPWCGPCRQVAPILEAIAAEHTDKLSIVKLNIDDNPQTPTRYGVTGIPTLALFHNGELVKTIVGAKPKSALLSDLSPWL